MTTLSMLLVSPPLSEPALANLAIELLAERARAGGHRAKTLHGALAQPRSFRGNMIHGLGAPGCFTHLYHGLNPVEVTEELVAALNADFGAQYRYTQRQLDGLTDRFLAGTADAERCVRRIVDAIPPNEYDIIGFAIGFDAQKMPAAAVAAALRARGERGLFIAGGTGTDGPMGPALLEQFPEYDLVLQGEVDDSWPLLLDRIAAGEPVDDVPGCVFRRGESIVSTPEAPVSPSFLAQPVVDYTDFLEQRRQSAYRDGRLILLLETSRGCWWGRKHQCTFCGIRNVVDEYRAQDPARAVSSIVELYDRFRPDLIYCTDSIAPVDYDAEVWPALAEARRARGDWRLFYETKSNLRRRTIAAMARAGVRTVQPGIESFVTSSLRLMDKGATAMQQVAFLKWARAYGINVTYGVITGMPGETPADLRSMVATMARLDHLQPPNDVTRLVLHRFSPHFNAPGTYGIENVRPFATQRVIYRCPDERLMRLCYQLNFSVASQGAEHEAARADVVAAVGRWRDSYRAGAGLWLSVPDGQKIIGRVSPARGLEVEVCADPVESMLIDRCAEVTSLSRVAQLTATPAEQVTAAAARLADRGLLLLEGGSALSLLVPTGSPDPTGEGGPAQVAAGVRQAGGQATKGAVL